MDFLFHPVGIEAGTFSQRTFSKLELSLLFEALLGAPHLDLETARSRDDFLQKQGCVNRNLRRRVQKTTQIHHTKRAKTVSYVRLPRESNQEGLSQNQRPGQTRIDRRQNIREVVS